MLAITILQDSPDLIAVKTQEQKGYTQCDAWNIKKVKINIFFLNKRRVFSLFMLLSNCFFLISIFEGIVNYWELSLFENLTTFFKFPNRKEALFQELVRYLKELNICENLNGSFAAMQSVTLGELVQDSLLLLTYDLVIK